MTIVDQGPSNKIVEINNTDSIEDKMSRANDDNDGFPPMDPRIFAYPNPFN